jgi:hypothetical protein
MSTSNNYYYSTDSHNVTTTTTNNYTSVDSHDNGNVSLIGGGLLNGSLNNILSGVSLLNNSSVLSGNQVLSPTVNVGDVNLGISDVVHDVLNPNILNAVNVSDILNPALSASVLDGLTATVGNVLSPGGDLLSNIGVSDLLNGNNVTGVAGNILPIAGDVLSHVNVADVSHLTSNIGDILPIANGASDILNVGNIGNIAANVLPVTADILDHGDISHVLSGIGNGNLDNLTSNIAPSVGDIVSHLGNVDLSDLSANVPATVVAPVSGVLSNIANGDVHNVLPVGGDVLSHIGDLSNLGGVANGSIGDVVANIASFGSHDIGTSLGLADIGQNIGANVLGNVGSNLTGGDIGHLLTAATSLDLSDVGAALHAMPAHDVLTSGLDLDQLTNSVNLFDIGHADIPTDIHHG